MFKSRRLSLSLLVQIAAWLLILAIAFVTLSPSALRPHSGYSAGLERFTAYLFLGVLLALAYPRRFWQVALVIVVAAVGLEALQAVVATRHMRLVDSLAKLAGGGMGLILGRLVFIRLSQRYSAATSLRRPADQ